MWGAALKRYFQTTFKHILDSLTHMYIFLWIIYASLLTLSMQTHWDGMIRMRWSKATLRWVSCTRVLWLELGIEPQTVSFVASAKQIYDDDKTHWLNPPLFPKLISLVRLFSFRIYCEKCWKRREWDWKEREKEKLLTRCWTSEQ